MFKTRRYGWNPDSLDHRDHSFKATASQVRKLPPVIDWRGTFAPPVMDQRNAGSCTGCSASKAYEFISRKQQLPFKGSALFAYWNARYYIDTTHYDSGAEIRDAIKGLNEFGLSPEKTWAYSMNRVLRKPTKTAFTQALDHQTISYERIYQSLGKNDLNSIKSALALCCPVVFGFSVFPSFDRIGRSGRMPLPSIKEAPLGGHAVFAVGYSDRSRCLLIQNSWGSNWGAKGFFWMPYDFVENPDYCDDFWKLEMVE